MLIHLILKASRSPYCLFSFDFFFFLKVPPLIQLHNLFINISPPVLLHQPVPLPSWSLLCQPLATVYLRNSRVFSFNDLIFKFHLLLYVFYFSSTNLNMKLVSFKKENIVKFVMNPSIIFIFYFWNFYCFFFLIVRGTTLREK